MMDTVGRGQISINLITHIHYLRYFWRKQWKYSALTSWYRVLLDTINKIKIKAMWAG
jgi:hypothetical protein